MSANPPPGIIRQVILGLMAGVFALLAGAFLVAGIWTLLAEALGSAAASFILAAAFALVALVLALIRRHRSELARRRAADIDLGLALGRSFYTGFRAGRRAKN